MSDSRLEWHGQQAMQNVSGGLYEGIQKALEHLKAETQEDVPKDSGALRESARVDGDEAKITGRLSYNTPYAAKQHETVGYKHVEGKAKYLEDNFQSQQSNMANIIAEEVKREL